MRKQRFQWKFPAGLAVFCAVAVVVWAVQRQAPSPSPQSFAQLIERFSEPGGYFDTDNLVSNEKSYLKVLPALEQDGVRGGVYIGVGPDQNFSYIARIRPTVAFILDIRRDNLLLHLLFKALFAESRNRIEYLCLLTGRPFPETTEEWADAEISRLVEYVDSTEPGASTAQDTQLRDRIRGFGVEVSQEEIATIERFHGEFVREGLSLQFKTFGRAIQSYNPTFRELLLETDRAGQHRSFLASEEDFQFVRALQFRGGVIPVVGDLAGDHALAAMGEWMEERGERLSAFYVSNVEDYLLRDGRFAQYIKNLEALPHDSRSVVIRSAFGRRAEPDALPGYYTASTAQKVAELLANFSAGKYRSYSELLRQ
jgi:hypothetical protein